MTKHQDPSQLPNQDLSQLPDGVAAVIAGYRPVRLPADGWALAAPVVRDAVTRTGPSSVGAARIYLVALSFWLAGPSGWDRACAPDLKELLARERIQAAVEANLLGARATTVQRASALRTLGRAVGAIVPTVRVRHSVDLTPAGPGRAFLRYELEAYRDAPDKIAAALEGYTPKVLPEAVWRLVADDARALVAAAGPSTVNDVRVALSALASYLADPLVWDHRGPIELGQVLRTDQIVAHIGRTRFASIEAKAGRRKYLIRLGRVSGTIPKSPTRGSRSIPVDPFLAAGSTRPIPVNVLAAAKAIDQTDRPISLDLLAGEITRVRDSQPSKYQTWTDQSLHALADVRAFPPLPMTSTNPRPSKRRPSKPLSRRAALAAAKAELALEQEAAADAADGGLSRLRGPGCLAPDIRSAVEGYLPVKERRAVWETNRDLAVGLVCAYDPPTARNAGTVASQVAGYLMWAAARNGRDVSTPLQLTELLDRGDVELFLDTLPLTEKSKAAVRSVLRRIEAKLRPHAVPKKLGHGKPAAPYTPDECARWVRLASHQPHPTRQRRLALVIGLGLGAGLDATDFRHLTAHHLDTITIEGREILVVHVPGAGPRARTVAVSDTYAPLVRRGLDGHYDAGLSDDDLLVVNCTSTINITTPILGGVVSADRSEHKITTNRLRHTWLVAAMSSPISFADLMQAAGIRSARTLSELLEHCPAPDAERVLDTHRTLSALAALDTSESM